MHAPQVIRVWRGLTSEFPGPCHRPGTGVVSITRLVNDSRDRLHSLSFARMRPFLIAPALALGVAFGCAPRSAADMSAAEKTAIADSLKKLVVSAYDLSKPDPVKNLMSLYPTEGRVISASGGVTTTTRADLEKAINAFWTYVGQNMKSPKWEWTSMDVDVLAPDAAVMTSTYRVPHLTPTGMNHVIGGAWTAVFQKRGGRWVIIQEHLSDVQSNLNLQMGQMDMTTPAASSTPHTGH